MVVITRNKDELALLALKVSVPPAAASLHSALTLWTRARAFGELIP